ncbi:MAG: beta-phosphoglucomutase [Aristaeellaceae bacterium]
MQYKGIIFDLDGVICSTDEYHYQAWKALADRLAIPFDRERNNLLRGVSRMDSLSIILEKSDRRYSAGEKELLAEEKNRLYRQLLDGMSPAALPEDVRLTLQTLRQGRLKLAIGSSSKNTPLILKRIGLADFFDAVADGNCITRSKPDPEVFLKAAALIGLEPAACLVVEDAHAGVEAAVAGGFDCAAMGDARDDRRATYHLRQFSDLLTL